MAVELVGEGPALAAVEAALADVDLATATVRADDVGDPRLAIAVANAGDPLLERVNDRAGSQGFPWLGVELGGVGGYPLVDAAVAGFAPKTACYDCLATRVAANRDPEAEPTAAQPAHTARFAGAIAGRAAARLLADGDDAVFGTLVEVPHAQRTVLPVPDCACADEVDHGLSLAPVDRSLDESLARAERGLDERVGVVRSIGEVESVPAPYYLARACETGAFSDVTASRDAAGVDAGWDAAFMKALGEALERYAAGVYRLDECREAQVGDVADAVDPASFVCHTEPDGDESLHWVSGRDLHAGESASLPATFVHYPPAEQRFRPSITTGLGLGNGGCGAVLAGLYEVIERDAAVLAWYSTYEPMGLAVDDEGVADLRRRARVADLSATLTLVTQDVDVPVIAAAVHREEWPRLAVGSAAHLDPDRAARSALTEALQNWMELDGMGPEDADDATGAIGHYADWPDGVEGFLSPETTVPAASVGPADPPAGRDELDALLQRVADAGLTAYAAPTTTRDLRALGFEAVRVLVPAAQPLFFEDAYFGERAETVPADLGFEPALDRDHHPFP
jgi:ribosomal protein S12 methylthiotransferase accessory factor